MVRGNRPGERPWYRGPAAVIAAGAAAVGLLAALVAAVIGLSDDWSSPRTPVITPRPTTVASTPQTPHSRPSVITPSQTPSSFPTSASVSTTDISVTTETTSGTETTSATETTGASSSAQPAAPGSTTRKLTPPTRKRPSLNETETSQPEP